MGGDIKVLVIDNDPLVSNYLKNYISSFGYQVSCSAKENALSNISVINPSLIIINDISLRIQSIERLKSISDYYGKKPILLLMNNNQYWDKFYEKNDLDNIDFIKKPIDISDLKNKIMRLSISNPEDRDLFSTNKNDTSSDLLDTGADQDSHLLSGKSKKIQEIISIINQVAKTDITVLIGGESGTGKELVARSLYKCSLRRDKPFIKVLCAAIPETLLENELFGHEKGAFTGAYTKKPGKFEFANHGTIFLDEIGDIPFSLQAKLLQVLQDSEFSRIGGNEVKVDVRVIAATNKNLEKAVAEGIFREDLFYRLNVVSIHLPPLRERKDDIPILTELFLAKYNKQFNKTYYSLSSETLELFMEYNWPGNVRELENSVKRIVVLGDESVDLKKMIQSKENISVPVPATNVPDNLDSVQPDENLEISSVQSKKIYSLKKVGREAARKAEAEVILEVLRQTRWNRKEAAKVLGVSYKALLYKIRECGLQIQDPF